MRYLHTSLPLKRIHASSTGCAKRRGTGTLYPSNWVISHETRSVAAGFGRHRMLPPAANDTVQHWAKTAQTDHAILTFDIETGTRVASKVGNLPSKVGHDRPLGSRIIRYVHDGRTDGRTDKNSAYCPLAGGIINTPFGVGRLSRAPARRRGRNLKFRFLEVLSPDPRAKFRRPRSSVLGALGF